MELELMFSEQKWNILKCLADGKASPLQLAEKLNTTMANISQQLRLLEATSLVKKEKIRNRDRGKPRTLFSINNDCAYIALAVNGFAGKMLLRTNDHQKIILSIWFAGSPETNAAIENFYWKIKPIIGSVGFIGLDRESNELVVVSEKKSEIEKIAGKEKQIAIVFLSHSEAEKMAKSRKGIFSQSARLFAIHDSKGIMKLASGGE